MAWMILGSRPCSKAAYRPIQGHSWAYQRMLILDVTKCKQTMVLTKRKFCDFATAGMKPASLWSHKLGLYQNTLIFLYNCIRILESTNIRIFLYDCIRIFACSYIVLAYRFALIPQFHAIIALDYRFLGFPQLQTIMTFQLQSLSVEQKHTPPHGFFSQKLVRGFLTTTRLFVSNRPHRVFRCSEGFGYRTHPTPSDFLYQLPPRVFRCSNSVPQMKKPAEAGLMVYQLF